MAESCIAYLGPEGTFAHLVALHRCKGESLIPLQTIGDVFRYVDQSPERHGVVPIENSSGGTILDTVDCLIEPSCRLFVHEEISVCVELALLGHKGETPRVLYSHFAPLQHCESWLKAHFPNVARYDVSSTAEAAKRASKESDAMAISTRQAAQIYGLDLLEFPVGSDTKNVTQFFFIGHGLSQSQECSKSSMVVSLQDEPGSLCSFLEPFRASGVNLSRIISRPVRGQPGVYIFFMDILGTEKDEGVKNALNVVRKTSANVKVVGTYPVLPQLEETS